MTAPDFINLTIAYRARKRRQARPRVSILISFGTWTGLHLELARDE